MFQESHLTKHNLIEPCLNKLVNQLRSGDVEEPQEPEVSFDYQELQTLFADKGLDALLAKLKELKAAGLIESIKVSTDVDTGKTTVSFEYDGIEYEFTGTTGEAASGDDDNNQAESGHRDVVDTILNKFEEFFDKYYEQSHLIYDNGEHTEPGNNIDAETAQDVGNNNTPDIDTRDGAFDFSGINMTPEVQTTDDIYAALEPLKEQMHAYVKKQLEAAGLTYNQEIVEKQLNMIISQTVKSNGLYVDMLETMSTAFGVEANVKKTDLSKYITDILDRIDVCLYYDTEVRSESLKGQLINMIAPSENIYSFIEDGLTPYEDLRLVNTDDYFLTEEEKQLKDAMPARKGMEMEYILGAGDKAAASARIDIFSSHTAKYLKNQYNLSDAEIEGIIEKAKTYVLNLLDNESVFIYDFVEYCETLAVQQYLTNDPSVCKKAIDAANKTLNEDLKWIIRTETMHTEFVINHNGNIVFQDEDTQSVYGWLKNMLESNLKKAGIYELLGGQTVIESLIQAAWIAAYNTYDSSQKNDTESFVRTVFDNFNKIMNKLASNPEYLEVFTTNPAYGDEDLNEQLSQYYGDEKLNYKNNQLASNANYNTTMDAALNLLIQRYPTIDSAVITDIFAKAKQEAIDICNNDIKDCPYGTGNNSSRIGDIERNWGGKDSRDGDKFQIEMEQLVQLTLYCFDKLFYQWLSA